MASEAGSDLPTDEPGSVVGLLRRFVEEDAGPDETREAHLPGGSGNQGFFRVSVGASAAGSTAQIPDALPGDGVSRPLPWKNCALRERAFRRGPDDARRGRYRYSPQAGPPNRWRSGALPDMRLKYAAFTRIIALSLNTGGRRKSPDVTPGSPSGGSQREQGSAYADFLPPLSLAIPRPTKPRPNRAMVPGSGAEVGAKPALKPDTPSWTDT